MNEGHWWMGERCMVRIGTHTHTHYIYIIFALYWIVSGKQDLIQSNSPDESMEELLGLQREK